MDHYESELYGTIPAPQNVVEILHVVRASSGLERNVYVWRGHANVEWRMDSAAFRRLARTNSSVDEKSVQSYEKYLLNHATHQGYRYEAGRALSDFELLAKLQHHGAATRLIDFSRNMLTALWFVCASDLETTGLLFGVHTDFLGGGENQPEDRAYESIFKDLSVHKHPQTWQPPVVSKRIAAQSAQFLYSSVSDSKLGSLWVDDDERAFLPIAITPSTKRMALSELAETFDIRYLTLFPDIDGFGYANSSRFDEYESERW